MSAYGNGHYGDGTYGVSVGGGAVVPGPEPFILPTRATIPPWITRAVVHLNPTSRAGVVVPNPTTMALVSEQASRAQVASQKSQAKIAS
jgi:hypothetical protein